MALEVPAPSPTTEGEWQALEYNAKSAFTPSAPISRAGMLAGRKAEIERLIDAVLETGRHAVIFGERGVGKTSLANTFHQMIAGVGEDVIQPIRKQVSPEDTFSSLWLKVFREFKHQFTEDIGYGREQTQEVSASDLYANGILPDDVIRELFRASNRTTPVVIFDEFDGLNDSSAKALMSHTIKAITDSGVSATVVLVGVAEDVDTLIAEHRSVERNISEIKMPRMETDELNEILNSRLPRLGLKVESDARWKIVTLSRGLPEYVHALGRDAAVEAVRARRLLIKEGDVDKAIESFLQLSDQTLNNKYHRATDSNNSKALYRHVLLACALVRPDNNGRFAAKDVAQPLAGILGQRVGIDKFQSHLTAFSSEQRGTVLERTGKPRAYKYRFYEPKMQPYVIMQGIRDGMVSKEAMEILASPEQPRLSTDF